MIIRAYAYQKYLFHHLTCVLCSSHHGITYEITAMVQVADEWQMTKGGECFWVLSLAASTPIQVLSPH